ncbi:hypothetical protein [Paraburkholderia sp. C35]|uniref:hypothetical protein n=1 Tax=Paraburkholderia sp. C35 TaxID=2126993 RepID=UPI001EF51C7A|nr:hypothetical protein [Paraburkholderia sp. C35]
MKMKLNDSLTRAFALTCLVSSVLATVSAHAATTQNCGGIQLATCPKPLDAALPEPEKMLTWNQSERVIGFRNDYRNYAGDVFHHGAAKPLARAPQQLKRVSYEVHGKHYTLDDYLKHQNVAGLLVLKNGKVAYKYLGNGNTDSTL